MPNVPVRFTDRLFALALALLPTRAISHLAFVIAEMRLPRIKNALIRGFLRAYPAIDMSEAAEPEPTQYACFNDFFTRELAADVRPLPADDHTLACPVDGQLGMFGAIETGRLFQTKGVAYDLRQLVAGDDSLAAAFLGGRYVTLYLAPHNYHRVHMPLDGRLRETQYVPGRLFGVNPRCVRAIPRLFSRNERLVSCFDTAVGPVAVVMVGAFIVGGIHTRAAGRVCPPHQKARRHTSYIDAGQTEHRYGRGDPMGHFMLGSSVILLTGPDAVAFDPELTAGQPVRLNQSLGQLVPGA
ncbi:archaetidylserine decarboxylase [Salinisphaera sp. LB1]|uniref:archaetidylserine decarboxylase n=1 Tax=Salinisphaera sp. LB1 TaxID=2183911 RepID=UPI000D706DB3|nr:archaetidylserine decarboxylase [Salinisphaera sp. LB1]AWN17461.1 Phosphatidylserine decarboxylase [Salinisphaera sp. LB1]